jgi:hypothetical protein
MSLAFYNRLAAIMTRLRAFQRECLKSQDDLLRIASDKRDSLAARRTMELIRMLREQDAGVLRRARLLQATLTLLMSAIGLLILSSVTLGFSPVAHVLTIVAGVLFFAGAVSVFSAVCFAIAEIRAALSPIEMESRFVEERVEEFAREIGD